MFRSYPRNGTVQFFPLSPFWVTLCFTCTIKEKKRCNLQVLINSALSKLAVIKVEPLVNLYGHYLLGNSFILHFIEFSWKPQSICDSLQTISLKWQKCIVAWKRRLFCIFSLTKTLYILCIGKINIIITHTHL